MISTRCCHAAGQAAKSRVEAITADVQVGETYEGRVMKLQGGMDLGGSSDPFPGSIDNLVISAVGAEETFELPEGIELSPDCPKQVHFAPGGGLERRIHREPVRIPLFFLDGREDFVQINLYGTVE